VHWLAREVVRNWLRRCRYNRVLGSYPISESSGKVEDSCRGWVCAKATWVGVETVWYSWRECHSYVLLCHCSLGMFLIVCRVVKSMNCSHRIHHKLSWTSVWIWGYVSVDAHKPERGPHYSRFHGEETICCSTLVLHRRLVSLLVFFVNKGLGSCPGLHRTCRAAIPKVNVVTGRTTSTSLERTVH